MEMHHRRGGATTTVDMINEHRFSLQSTTVMATAVAGMRCEGDVRGLINSKQVGGRNTCMAYAHFCSKLGSAGAQKMLAMTALQLSASLHLFYTHYNLSLMADVKAINRLHVRTDYTEDLPIRLEHFYSSKTMSSIFSS